MTSPSSTTRTRKQVVYLVRHAEATHNIKEREAIQAAKARGIEDVDQARRAALEDASLLDAPLSDNGKSQVLRASQRLNLLDRTKYPPPKVVLVSPLRRVLMTATEMFLKRTSEVDGDSCANTCPPPRLVAIEALREKRTGYAADERLPVEILEQEFPHVDFTNLKSPAVLKVPKGEDNAQVRERGRVFLQEYLANNVAAEADSVAIVTHKGWLRELRRTLKEWVDQQQLQVDFDLDKWYQTLYGNAEIRVADFEWTTQQDNHNKLVSIVSRSVENAALLRSQSSSCSSSSSSEHSSERGEGGGFEDHHKGLTLASSSKAATTTTILASCDSKNKKDVVLDGHDTYRKMPMNLVEALKLFHFLSPRRQQQQQQE